MRLAWRRCGRQHQTCRFTSKAETPEISRIGWHAWKHQFFPIFLASISSCPQTISTKTHCPCQNCQWNGHHCQQRRSGEPSNTAKETNNRHLAFGDELKNTYLTKAAKVLAASMHKNGGKQLKSGKKCRVSSHSHLAFHIPPLPGLTDAWYV